MGAHEFDNMGQVTFYSLEHWNKLASYRPPDPHDDFYEARGQYVVVTCHFNLIERLHMLHGFARTMEDFYLAPEKIEKVLDMTLDFKLAQI